MRDQSLFLVLQIMVIGVQIVRIMFKPKSIMLAYIVLLLCIGTVVIGFLANNLLAIGWLPLVVIALMSLIDLVWPKRKKKP